MNYSMTPMLAQASDWHAQTFGQAIWYATVFAFLGIFLVFVGYRIFDLVITRIRLDEEIGKGNIAAAILGGAAIIALAIIIAAAMS